MGWIILNVLLSVILCWWGIHFYKKDQRVWYLLLALYLIILVWLCLVPFPKLDFISIPSGSGDTSSTKPMYIGRGIVNLKLFDDMSSDIIFNILMTVPFGFMVKVLKPKFKWYQVILIGFLLSLFIESSQFLYDQLFGLKRWSDVNDLFTNTVGSLIGFWVASFFISKKHV